MASFTTAPEDFDPFEFNIFLRWAKGLSWVKVTALALLVPLAAIAGSAASGRLGPFDRDIILSDISSIFHIGSPDPTAPDFPLARDIYSWTQAAAITLGIVLLHRQWCLMSTTLSELASSGALQPKSAISHNSVSRLLLIKRLSDGHPPGDAFGVFMASLMDKLRKAGPFLQLLLLGAAWMLAELLIVGQRHGLFEVLAPSSFGEGERQAWAETAYRDWWAGEVNITGHLAYIALAVLAMYVILSFQIPGILAIYVVVGIYFLAEPSADWLNRDDRYGWESLARTYRTVVAGNALLAVTLADVLLFIGVQNYGWIIGLLVLYMIFVPLFVLIPWVVFRRAERSAKKARVRELDAQLVGVPAADLAFRQSVAAEIAKTNAARIRPLRLRKRSIYGFVVAFLLPIILTIAQIVLQH